MSVKTWPMREARNRLSEVIERARTEGPQTITRHGAERVVVISIEDYRALVAYRPDFKAHLLGGPKVDDFTIERDRDTGRSVLDDERLDAGTPGRLVDGRPHDDESFGFHQRLVSGGTEDLRAVQHPMVAVAHGGRLNRRRVRAAAGLGDRHSRPLGLAATEAGKKPRKTCRA